MAQWYWTQDGQKHGPVEDAGLRQLAAKGQLRPTDMIWREGLPNWVPAEKVKGLFPPRGQTPAPPAATPPAAAAKTANPATNPPPARPSRPAATATASPPPRPATTAAASPPRPATRTTAPPASPRSRPPVSLPQTLPPADAPIVATLVEPSPSMRTQGNQFIVEAMNKWSSPFSKLMLPSRLGSKAVIKQCSDEGAKVLSMGVYMGIREAVVDAIPYDGSTYEGNAMIEDDSAGTLWAYETNIPDGFAPVDTEKFVISLGHVFKCHQCRGQGRIKCQTCGGRVRWTTKNTFSNGYTDHVCNCGDGHQNCPDCTGFGQLLKALRVATRYVFAEKKAREYAGRLPEALLMGSAGNIIYRHVAEFKQRVITEAIDGFDADEFERLMVDVHSEFKSEVSAKAAGQMVNPQILHELIDGYFRELPNPVTANKRLQEEVLPVRLKCEVSDVPVTGVKYEYEGRNYSLYVYGNDGKVWVDGGQPSEFTWKLGVVLGLVASALILILILIASANSGAGGSPDRRGGTPSGRPRTSSTFQQPSQARPPNGFAGTLDVQQSVVQDHTCRPTTNGFRQASQGQEPREPLQVAKVAESNLVGCGLWKTTTLYWA